MTWGKFQVVQNPLVTYLGGTIERHGDLWLPRAYLYGFHGHNLERWEEMPNGRKRKRKKIATHKRKKRLRKNRHKKK